MTRQGGGDTFLLHKVPHERRQREEVENVRNLVSETGWRKVAAEGPLNPLFGCWGVGWFLLFGGVFGFVVLWVFWLFGFGGGCFVGVFYSKRKNVGVVELGG